jgi:hypothetical protein
VGREGRADAAHVPHGDHHAGDDAHEQHRELDDVGPHDGRHAADGVVENRDHAHQQDAGPDGEPERGREHHGGRVKADPRGDAAREDEHTAHEEARSPVESMLEVFVQADQLKAAQDRHEHRHDHDHGEGHRELVLEPFHTAPWPQGDEGRDAEERVRRRLRGHDRHGQRPPRQLAAAHVVIGVALLSAGHPGAHAEDGGEVEADDGPVEGGHGRGLADGRDVLFPVLAVEGLDGEFPNQVPVDAACVHVDHVRV